MSQKTSQVAKQTLPDGPKVAIVVPAYRNRSTIEQTLRSVLAQPELNLISKVVVSEDHGGDETTAIANSVVEGVGQILVRNNEKNLGEAGNMLAAIEALPAGTEWILILHGDDFVHPSWLSTMLEEIAKAPAEVMIVCSSYDTLDENGKLVPAPRSSDRVSTWTGPENIASTLSRGCWWHISGSAIRLSAYRELGGRNSSMPLFGDWDFLLRVFHQGWGITYIEKSLMTYRLHPSSVSAFSWASLRDVSERLSIVESFHFFLGWPALVEIELSILKRMARFSVHVLLSPSLKKGRDFLRVSLLFSRHLLTVLFQRLFNKRVHAA